MSEATAAGAVTRERDTGLKRVIGANLLFFFILGDMLGGGIYALVGEVAGEVGGAAWSAFVAAFVLALLTALSYAELVTKYPHAAGAALYTHKAFRQPFVTFMVAFTVMASGITSASFLAKAFAGDYFTTFVDAPVIGIALVFFAVVTVINLIGISESVRLNAAITLVELAGLVIIVVIGIAAFGTGEAVAARSFQFQSGTTPFLLIVSGASLAFYALIGFEDSVNVAEETKDPSRVFPRALLRAMMAAGILYVVVSFMATAVVDLKRLSGSDAPLLEVVKVGPLGVPETLFSIIALFALSNGALINMIMASRLVYGMSKQGVVPSVFQRILPGRRTPWAAIAFTSAIAFVLIATTGDLGILADTTVVLLLLAFSVVNVSVLMLRRDRVDHDHFRTLTPLPILGAIVCLALVAQTLLDQANQPIVVRVVALLVIGVVLYVINRFAPGERRATDESYEKLEA